MIAIEPAPSSRVIMTRMGEPTFEQLLSDARAGREDAVEALIDRHVDGLRAFIRLRAGAQIRRRESCSDLVQSVLREVLVDLKEARCGNEATFRQWLFGVALHKIQNKADYHQAQKRDVRREEDARTSSGVEHGLLRSYAGLGTPSRQAAAQEEIARIEAAFDQLSEDQRDIILQVRLLGRTYEDLASEKDATPEALRKQLSRARARLGLLLSE